MNVHDQLSRECDILFAKVRVGELCRERLRRTAARKREAGRKSWATRRAAA